MFMAMRCSANAGCGRGIGFCRGAELMSGGDAGDATVQLRPKVRRADGARQGRCRDHDWRRTRSEICLWRIALSETRGVVQQSLILKRASASRPSGEWNDDDF